MLNIYIDADGCAVKDEVYKVAERYSLRVILVANKRLTHPIDPRIEMQVVGGGFDAADDWIVENSEARDILVTSDILLADRCIKKSVRVLSPKGKEWTEDSIGSAIAGRELSANLRHMGEMRGGPSAMEKKDRSQFLASLDQIIQAVKRGR
jgi:uncharacterized protein YaiI (UPF0178 family)